MNFLDKFRYSFDNLNELSITKNRSTETKTNYNNPQLKSLLSTSVKVTPEIFPRVAKAIDQVFDRLKIKNNFNFFITSNHLQTQALCAMMPQSTNAEIIITSKMIDLLNSEELQSVIGHEVSHFYYQHNLYPNPNQARNKAEFLNLLHLSRAAEISSDRAGFLGSGSLEHSLRSMLKITSGLGDEHLQFNFSSYLNQLRELAEVKGDQTQLYSTHPTFLNRMQALIWFSMSREYHEFFETSKKGVYDLKTVDQKINESIKKVTGNELDVSNKEIIDRSLLFGALWIYLGDKKFSKQEQEKFTKRFGNKTTVSILGLLNISNMPIIEKKVMSAYAEASMLLKSDREKIIKELKEIYQGVDEHSEDSKQNFERLIEILN
tara:strand:+ start:727 stop:1857 length:1131 start_codon:yes stop_codon:yes gene_type:complete